MEKVALTPGYSYEAGYLKIDMQVKTDGIYPYISTPEATMTLPWQQETSGEITVCLLKQSRVDANNEPILKICGGYNRDLSPEVAALLHTKEKLGLVPSSHSLFLWRKCLGVGPQYNFPILYTFLRNPVEITTPLKEGCERVWLPLQEACELATSKNTNFFDDFSTAMLLILLTRSPEL